MKNQPKVPAKPPLPIQYCRRCGRVLRQTILATYYSIDTGEQENHWRWVCNQKRWYNRHTSKKKKKDGNSYGYQI